MSLESLLAPFHPSQHRAGETIAAACASQHQHKPWVILDNPHVSQICDLTLSSMRCARIAMEDLARRRGLRSMPDVSAAELPMSSFSARYRALYEFCGWENQA